MVKVESEVATVSEQRLRSSLSIARPLSDSYSPMLPDCDLPHPCETLEVKFRALGLEVHVKQRLGFLLVQFPRSRVVVSSPISSSDEQSVSSARYLI